MPGMEVAVMIIRAVAIVPRRANAYADTARSRIETNLCRGRQGRADRDRRHKRNSKFPHNYRFRRNSLGRGSQETLGADTIL